jgi:hypothetical protein
VLLDLLYLQKQIQINQLRTEAKGKRAEFTKEDIAKNIRKYRYAPPDPRTKFFERNAKETTKFREIQPVPQFTRKTYVDVSIDLEKKISRE